MTITPNAFRLLMPLGTVALLLLAAPAAAQQSGGATMPTTGLRAELIQDVNQLEDKYLGLAEAAADHYTWRPGEGVRSVSEVLMHVANANVMFGTMAGAAPPAELQGMDRQQMQAREQLTDPQAVQDALAQSFEVVRQAIAGVPDDELDATVQLFGQEATVRRVLNLLVTHMHEHLGQAIAYARTNGVTPPWSND